ncbi:hypothetical protein CEUSTIGMA_g9213.t1 [Chlamydomonas eustigma]|uniref:Suppressor of white apricot N-terminal domain-containing protein n=1 Tax=Chlamydomonas eustigma TaxID=1157962 RepID=A0A250XFD8_9CHLO|nr:hypothetical protein CEUSTIGMA_g9213.t1 [Chlamydomonas eustigma]|eukprot:GAX81785.1 hypothetical protein CEUSTIGMA_g9213.t1 [Chlamydomonas eustigma]
MEAWSSKIVYSKFGYFHNFSMKVFPLDLSSRLYKCYIKMANYYHEARGHVKALKKIEVDNVRRAERRAEIQNAHAEHPLNFLSIDGRQMKLYKNKELHSSTEKGDGLIPWSVQPDVMIDRFDGRALLDLFRDYDSETVLKKQRTAEEEKLQKILAFESYRDLVHLMAKGLSERQGLDAAVAKSLETRAAARAAAIAQTALGNHPQPMPVTFSTSSTAGTPGTFSAVGFNYGTSNKVHHSESSDSSSEEEDGESDDEAGYDATEAEQERLDDTAFEHFKIEDFCQRLHKALQQEGEQEAAMKKKPRSRMGRKKARERARRMAGQGLGATNKDWRDPMNATTVTQRKSHQDSAVDHMHFSDVRRSRSRSPASRRDEHPRAEYITEFVSGGNNNTSVGSRALNGGSSSSRMPSASTAAINRRAFEVDDNIIEALPDTIDPARMNMQSFPSTLPKIQGIRPAERAAEMLRIRREIQMQSHGQVDRGRQHQCSRSRERNRSRSREREKRSDSEDGGRKGRSRGSYQEGSGRRYSRSRSREGRSRYERGGRRTSRSRERSWVRGRENSSSRSRSRSRSRSASKESNKGGSRAVNKDSRGQSTSAIGDHAGEPKSGAAPKSLSGPVQAGKAQAQPAETPQERLKRIMAAQLTKQAGKDQTANHMKKAQAEKELQARATIQKVALNQRPRSRSPTRAR